MCGENTPGKWDERVKVAGRGPICEAGMGVRRAGRGVTGKEGSLGGSLESTVGGDSFYSAPLSSK